MMKVSVLLPFAMGSNPTVRRILDFGLRITKRARNNSSVQVLSCLSHCPGKRTPRGPGDGILRKLWVAANF